MKEVSALLLREGSSDRFEAILKASMKACGAEGNITPYPFDPGRKRLSDALGDVVAKSFGNHLIFVHRDADNAGSGKRREEICSAVEASRVGGPVVPVIPVKETEAWILFAMHDPEFRAKTGLKDKIVDSLPHRNRISEIQAKETLRGVHKEIYASRKKKGRAAHRHPSFPADRAQWMAALTETTFLSGCQSFEDFFRDLETAVDRL